MLAVASAVHHVLVHFHLLLQFVLMAEEPYEGIEPQDGLQQLHEAELAVMVVGQMTAFVEEHVVADTAVDFQGHEYAVAERERRWHVRVVHSYAFFHVHVGAALADAHQP